jgi:hypothetical protein
MNSPLPNNSDLSTSDNSSWAKPVSALKVSAVPTGAVNLNVDGRQLVSPLQGFGQLWQKTYRVRLSGLPTSTKEVVDFIKGHLPELMPSDSRFYPSVTGVKPGEVVLINATLPGIPGGMPVSTGVMVLYADDESFTLMCPEGHPEAGWNTFSAHEEEGAIVVQIQSLGRANDPIFEFGFRFLGGSAQQEKIWRYVLKNLAAHYQVAGQVQTQKSLVDSRLQWSEAKNIWHNSVIRTTLSAPTRWVRKLFNR